MIKEKKPAPEKIVNGENEYKAQMSLQRLPEHGWIQASFSELDLNSKCNYKTLQRRN